MQYCFLLDGAVTKICSGYFPRLGNSNFATQFNRWVPGCVATIGIRMKRLSKKTPKAVKGMPTAVLLSILIHAALFLLAGMFVVFTVVKSKEVEFAPPKAVERPKMKLKKPKVKVKKSSKPRPTTRIVTTVKRASMPDIQLPEMSGMTDGLTGGIDGFDVLPDFGEVSVFGSGQSIGNDFVGTFYDTKQDRTGRPIPYSTEECYAAVRKFIKSGWRASSLGRFYKSPKKRYATCFVMPLMPSSLVPAFFGEPDIEGTQWITHYKGQLVHKEGITFRFMGWGDGALAVRVEGKIVLLAGWLMREGQFWQSSSADDRRWRVSNGWWCAGDWITLEPGVPLDMEIVMVESGGLGTFMLAVQEKGVEYEKRKIGTGPIFPAFKTAEPSRDLLDAIYKDLVPGEISLTNGPVFCDYDAASLKREATNAVENTEAPATVPQEREDTSPLRTWTGMDGKTIEAEYVMVMGDKVVLKTAKGKQKRIPLVQLSPEDREYIELSNPPKFNIDFSAKTKQVFSVVHGSSSGETVGYDYCAKVRLKQISSGDYNHQLHVECFAIGKEVEGNRFYLIDRQESSFMPTKKNGKSHEFSGRTVRLENYWLVFSRSKQEQHRGQKQHGYLITVTDERGKIIQHQESNPWLYENLENLKLLPVGAFMDKNCIRTFPTPPPSVPIEDVWGAD